MTTIQLNPEQARLTSIAISEYISELKERNTIIEICGNSEQILKYIPLNNQQIQELSNIIKQLNL